MARRIGKVLTGLLAVSLPAVLLGPFLVPVPPLKGTRSAAALADADSQFVRIHGLDVHVKTAGQGEPALVLLHGFGASLYSWQAVMQPLGQLGQVIAYDRTGFGLSERPLSWQGQSPYSATAQIDLLVGLLDHYRIRQAVLVGNSAGGTLAVQAALAHPERVKALILVDAAIYSGGGASAWLGPLLRTPQMRHLGPLLVRQLQTRGPELVRLAWHDPSRLSPETLALYEKPLQVDNWDKALWEFTAASRPSGLAPRLRALTLPVLVITGDDDRIVPTQESLRLAGELPNAELQVISQAGHVPHEEQPGAFLQAVRAFWSKINP